MNYKLKTILLGILVFILVAINAAYNPNIMLRYIVSSIVGFSYGAYLGRKTLNKR